MKHATREALKVTALYILVSLAWVTLFDGLVFRDIHDPETLSMAESVKGWAFVLLTGGLLYVLVRGLVRKLEQAQERAWHAQRSEALGRMAAAIAHDFNNVLQVVTASIELGQEGVPAASMAGQAFRDMDRAAERGRGLVRQLMAFARQEPLTPSPVDLDEWLRACGPLLGKLVRLPARLVVGVEAGLGQVVADPVRLEQVLMNLVANAVDAMEGEGVVTLTARRRANWVELGVSDTGPGIPEELLPRLFEPFFTTKGDRGTGLGLATVHDIVHQCGGRVEVDGRPGQGAEFRVLLPPAPPHPAHEFGVLASGALHDHDAGARHPS